MNKLLVLFLIFSLPIFSIETQEEVFQFDSLRITKKPISSPRGAIPAEFICENAILLQSIELRNITDMPPEAALFIQTSQTAEALVKFYESVFLARDWRILQKDNKDNKFVILGERSKKVMTVLIRDEKDYRVVKIFFRRPGF